MTTGDSSNLLQCDHPDCDFNTGESVNSRVADRKLRIHKEDTHQKPAAGDTQQQLGLADLTFGPGDRVYHKMHGPGTVRELSPSGRLWVKFDRHIESRIESVNPADLVIYDGTADEERERLIGAERGYELADHAGEVSTSSNSGNDGLPVSVPGDTLISDETPSSFARLMRERRDLNTAAEELAEEVGKLEAVGNDIDEAIPDQVEAVGNDMDETILEPDFDDALASANTEATATADKVSQESNEIVDEAPGNDPDPVTAQGAPPSSSVPLSALPDNLLVPNWAVFCVGVGEAGTKIIAQMNKKPDQLPSRNPVFYPVHCSHFDTQEGSKSHIEGHKPLPGSYMIRATPEGSEIAGGLAAETAGVDVLGVGGIPYAAYLSFKRVFDNVELDGLDTSDEQSELRGIDYDYFKSPLWSGQDRNKVGPHEEIHLSGDVNLAGGDITNFGLITFNSARGGTGSGGVSWIHNFINRRSRGSGRRLSMGLSLNVSVLPEDSQRLNKPLFPAYSVSSFYRLAKADIHGVILVSNQLMLERNDHIWERVNSHIREMLIPIIVSPTGKYTVANATSTTDQADISKAISTSVFNRETSHTDIIPGLCVIGFAEEFLTGDAAPEYITSNLAKLALEKTTCEWARRTGAKATGYRAFLSGPPAFFESNPTRLVDELTTALHKEIHSRAGASTSQTSSAINGDVSVQSFAHAESIRLSVLLYNVNVPELDRLVKEGLALDGDSGSDIDGWDQILGLTEEQVARMENAQIDGDVPPDDRTDSGGSPFTI